MELVTLSPQDLETEHICCAIGSDAVNRASAQTKKDWMKQVFPDGLVFRRLDERGKVFIEYQPIESVWKPLEGSNYLVINCLWVSGKFKGNGWSARLLETCIDDARAQGKSGVAVVSSTKVRPFLTDKRFFVRHGFETVDTAPPYFELLALKLNDEVPPPRFSPHIRENSSPFTEGLEVVYSNQCVFTERTAEVFSREADLQGVPVLIRKLLSSADARSTGGPTGTFSIYFKGQFITHEMMSPASAHDLVASLKNSHPD